jgi:hypothetical protein
MAMTPGDRHGRAASGSFDEPCADGSIALGLRPKDAFGNRAHFQLSGAGPKTR